MQLRQKFYYIFMLGIIAFINMSVGIVLAQDNALNGGTLRGQIKDTTEAQNPIEGVEIKIVAQDGTEYTTKTDANGNYKRAGLPAGRYLINIAKEGYGERVGKPVVIVNGGDHFMPLRMSKNGGGFFRDIFAKERPMKGVAKERTQILLQLVGENLRERYSLNRDVVKALRQSVSESVDTALKSNTNVRNFNRAVGNSNTELLEALLAHPECKTAFAEHLSETQLQDYINAVKARLQQNRHASARLITGLISRELSLTTPQHENVEQLLINAAENESFPTSKIVLGMNSQDAINFLHYGFKISMDRILSQAQSEVWQVSVTHETNKSEGKAETFTQTDEDKKTLLQERQKQLAEAKLVAHTELLGTLNEDASRRLTVASKGAIEQYFEAQANTPEVKLRELTMKLEKAIESGEITREQAGERYMAAAAELIGKNGEMPGPVTADDITRHPLYQQTIKDVLSEDAFAQYTAHQAQKADLLKRASSDAVIACLDAQTLLTSAQREKFKLTISKLTFSPSSDRPAMDMFSQFTQRVDRKGLNQWQWGEFQQRLSSIF